MKTVAKTAAQSVAKTAVQTAGRLVSAAAVLTSLALVTSLVLPEAVASASAPTGLESGYWWMAQPSPGAFPPPPQVPSGGLYVSSDAAGSEAISAVRFRLPADSADPKLVLHIASLHDVDSFSIDAYPAQGAWKPASAGAWSARPSYGPVSKGVAGSLAADQTTVTFDLRSFVNDGEVDVVIAPATSATSPSLNPTFDVSFEPLSVADVTTTAVASPGASASPAGAASSPASTGLASPASPAASESVPAAAPTGTAMPSQSPYTTPSGQPLLSLSPALGPTSAPSVGGALPASSSNRSTIAAAPASTRLIRRGRSTRDTIVLAFLLADGLVFLLWRGSSLTGGKLPGIKSAGSKSTRAPRPSIYDLPDPA